MATDEPRFNWKGFTLVYRVQQSKDRTCLGRLKMNWDARFASIVKETEQSLARVKASIVYLCIKALSLRYYI